MEEISLVLVVEMAEIVVDAVDDVEGFVIPRFSIIKGELPVVAADMDMLLDELLAAYIICFSTSKQATKQQLVVAWQSMFSMKYLLLIRCLPYVYFFKP